jgi:hypothetical protein
MPTGMPPNDRSHALRGNAARDALRPKADAERPLRHSHAERGNDQFHSDLRIFSTIAVVELFSTSPSTFTVPP